MEKYGKYDVADVFDVYAREVIASLLDEFWLDSSGHAQYANGEYGDYNHEMLAEKAILSELGYDYDVESLEDANNIFNDKLKNAKPWAPDDGTELGEYFAKLLEEHGEDGWKNHAEIDEFLFWKSHNHITDETHLKEAQTKFNNVWSGLSSDPRTHAIKHMQWYRLAYNEIETWNLTVEDAYNIARGLYDAYDDDAENHTYNIEVKSSQEYLTRVPFQEIIDGTVVHRLKPRPQAQSEPTPMQQTLDSVDLMNELSYSAPVSDAQYQNSLQTKFPDNDKIQELYRYQGASCCSWYRFLT